MSKPEHLDIIHKKSYIIQKWLESHRDVHLDLSEALLPGIKLKGLKLNYTNLSKAWLEGAILTDVDFSESLFCDADLRKSKLMKCNLSGCALAGVNLREARLHQCNLNGADLIDAKLEDADLSGSTLVEATLVKANLTGANLSQCDLTRVMFADETGASANIAWATLDGATFTTEENSDAYRSILDLATVRGLGTAFMKTPEVLSDYLQRAFDYAHSSGCKEATTFPDFVAYALSKIRHLRSLMVTEDPPAALCNVLDTLSRELIAYLRDHPEELQRLRPHQFEELIAEVLASFGWSVQLTAPTKDGGYDIFAISGGPSPKSSWIIECKKYAPYNKVGVEVVRALYGTKIALSVGMALLATTSTFTRGAIRFKSSRYDLDLVDKHGLVEWLNSYRPSPDGKLYIRDGSILLPPSQEERGAKD